MNMLGFPTTKKEGWELSFPYPKAEDILEQMPNTDSKAERQETGGEEEA